MFNFLCYFQDIAIEKDFLKRLSSDVIPPNLIGVKFDDIGALQNLKDSFKELVIFPFQRPQLSCKRKLTEVILFSGLFCFFILLLIYQVMPCLEFIRAHFVLVYTYMIFVE